GSMTESDPVYAYLRALDLAEEAAELGRLLYVGATRARRRLSLLAVARVHGAPDEAPRWKAPARGTALERMWEALSAQLPQVPADRTSERNETLIEEEGLDAPPPASSLVRLPADFRIPSLAPCVPAPIALA